MLHHSLLVDLALSMLGGDSSTTLVKNNDNYNNITVIGEMEAELLLCIIDHCGPQLRADDPMGLKSIISAVTRISKNENNMNEDNLGEYGKEMVADGSSRVKYMLEAMADLKNNKSRRIQATNADTVKKLRKWLGTVKSSLGCKTVDNCLRVSLQDLLDADQRGRWWRAGAKWVGRNGDSNPNESSRIDSEENVMADSYRESQQTNVVNDEERNLLALASKLHMNTSIRKSIFMVLMSSRDVSDAFERLSRLELRGKQDRDIVRVIVECCGQEKTYNPFYAELSCLICHQSRQYKTTFQFAYWDVFRQINDHDISKFDNIDSDVTIRNKKMKDRKLVNLARLLAHLICRFHLSLSVLKPLDMVQPNDALMMFLATLFMALFSFKVNGVRSSFQICMICSSTCSYVYVILLYLFFIMFGV